MGKIKITVQTEKRLKAITELSIAIRNVAEALNESVKVVVENCTFNNNDIGAQIDTQEDIKETKIFEEKE